MKLLSGKEIAAKIKEEVANKVKTLNRPLTLAAILVGNNPASEKYIDIKERACKELGIDFQLHRFKENTDEKSIYELVIDLNNDDAVTGIMVQLPLPKGLNQAEILEAINPKKDVDGLTSTNLGKVVKGLKGIYPATADGVLRLLGHYKIPVVSKRVVVIGQSNLVGKPLAQMLLNNDATVTIANEMTKNLKEITLKSEIIITAVGQPGLITGDMVTEGSVVIDIGTTLVDGGLVGDVEYDSVKDKVSAITPVPGGVGPMTVAMLLNNLIEVSKEQLTINS